ncbi:MAG: helix-turn-helix domain-containing protein [Acidobacteriota bacterium]
MSEELSENHWLDLYLGLSPEQRSRLFVDTSTAAEKTGLSQRTIQSWIELGNIKAVLIGKKYKVYVESLTDFLMRRALRFSR